MPGYQTGESVRYKPVGGMFPSVYPYLVPLVQQILICQIKGPESHTSESVGTIRQVSTTSTNLTGRNVEASKEEPRYEVILLSYDMEWYMELTGVV